MYVLRIGASKAVFCESEKREFKFREMYYLTTLDVSRRPFEQFINCKLTL